MSPAQKAYAEARAARRDLICQVAKATRGLGTGAAAKVRETFRTRLDETAAAVAAAQLDLIVSMLRCALRRDRTLAGMGGAENVRRLLARGEAGSLEGGERGALAELAARAPQQIWETPP